MVKERLVIVVFPVIIAVVVWVLSACIWASKRVWIPEVSKIERLLIGLTVWTNIAMLIIVFVIVYGLLLVFASKTKLFKLLK